MNEQMASSDDPLSSVGQPETVVRSGGLACFRGVQAAGCEHCPRITRSGETLAHV